MNTNRIVRPMRVGRMYGIKRHQQLWYTPDSVDGLIGENGIFDGQWILSDVWERATYKQECRCNRKLNAAFQIRKDQEEDRNKHQRCDLDTTTCAERETRNPRSRAGFNQVNR